MRVETGGGPSSNLVLSPDGTSAYLTNGGDPQTTNPGSVFQYDVGADGALTPKHPRSVSAGSYPFGVAVAPDGASVYVTDSGRPGSTSLTWTRTTGPCPPRIPPRCPPVPTRGSWR